MWEGNDQTPDEDVPSRGGTLQAKRSEQQGCAATEEKREKGSCLRVRHMCAEGKSSRAPPASKCLLEPLSAWRQSAERRSEPKSPAFPSSSPRAPQPLEHHILHPEQLSRSSEWPLADSGAPGSSISVPSAPFRHGNNVGTSANASPLIPHIHSVPMRAALTGCSPDTGCTTESSR